MSGHFRPSGRHSDSEHGGINILHYHRAPRSGVGALSARGRTASDRACLGQMRCKMGKFSHRVCAPHPASLAARPHPRSGTRSSPSGRRLHVRRGAHPESRMRDRSGRVCIVFAFSQTRSFLDTEAAGGYSHSHTGFLFPRLSCFKFPARCRSKLTTSLFVRKPYRTQTHVLTNKS